MSDSQENAENCKLRAFEKNNYFYGKLMTVRDFVLEQQYLNDKRWLINNLLFGSGTVCGLNVSSVDMNIVVKSGFAIDKCGREIILPENVSLTLSDKDKPSKEKPKKAVYIYYKECPKERVRAQTASTCDEVCANNRTEESYDFKIRDVTEDSPGSTKEDLCGIWNNHVTKVCDDLTGSVPIRFKRKAKKYVSVGDLFEISLEITNLDNSKGSAISIVDTLPSGLKLVEGSNIVNKTILSGETIKNWYVVRVSEIPPNNEFILKANLNGDSSSIIKVKSQRDISENLFDEMIKYRTDSCLEGEIDSGVKIAELSLADGSIIIDNTKRKFVNNNKNMTKMLECLRVQASALEDQTVGIKDKLAPSNVLISASPTEIYADGEQVSSININVRNDADVGLPDIDVNLISTLGNITNRVKTGPGGSATAILTSGTISGNAAVLATTGIGAAVTQVAFKSTTGSIEGYVKEKTDETIHETKLITGAIVSVGTITTMTDSEGHYSLKNVPNGNQVVWAFASGYDKASSLVDVKANQVNRIDISLDPISISGTIKGKVTDIEGNVIENTVHVTAEGITASTDETGNYTLSNVPAGTHTVTASSDGYQTQNRASVVVTDDGITSGIDFMLEKATGTIKGRVTIFPKLIPLDLREGTIDERIALTPVIATPVRILPIPTGIEGATVSVLGTSKSVLTDSSGNYEIRNVPLGTQTVIASAPNYNASTSSVLVEANVAITLNFQLKPLVTTGTVTGRVTTLRKRIVPVCISSLPALTIYPGLTRTIDSTIVRPLDTTVVRPLDTATVRPVDTPFVRPIPCNAGNPDYRCFAGGPSNLMEEIGIPGATVSVAGLSTVTDSQGNYSIRNVPEGSQVVSASAAGYVSQRTNVTVPAGGTATADFQLVKTISKGIISGRVTQFMGSIRCLAGLPVISPSVGIRGALVSVAGTTLSDVTDDSGYYTIPDVPTGSYTVNASASGYNAGTRGATVNENQTSTMNFQLVPLPTTGEISGRVANTSGSPIVSATVRLVEVNNSVNTDASGNYRIPNVRPGSHTVSVSASGYNSSSRTVNVIAGQVTAADFVLSREILCVAGRPDSEIICTGARPREVTCVASGPTAPPIPETRCVSAIPRDIELPCTGATPRIFVPDRPIVEPPIDRPVIGTPGIDRPVIGAPTVVRPISKRTGAGTACPTGRPTIAPEEKTQPQVKAKKGRKK